jgi:hypothetical protein
VNPFLGSGQVNPFLASGQVNPFLDSGQANPFLDSGQVNPFLVRTSESISDTEKNTKIILDKISIDLKILYIFIYYNTMYIF